MHAIIEVDGRAAGQVIVDHRPSEIRIVDIALLPEFRCTGTGAAVVRRYFDDADATGRAVTCSVMLDNPARWFWRRVGMEERAVHGAHIAMERPCRTTLS